MRRVVSLIALACLGLLFPLLLAEIGLRLFAPQPLAVNVSEWDPHYGWHNRPGTTGFFRTSEYRMEVRIDSLGLRDEETTRAKPPGTFRILGLGDSFAFGHGVSVDSCFLSVAERDLDRFSRSRGGPRVEVLNAGVGKWATAQEYLYLMREGFGFEPDVVVLAFCIDNDIEGNAEGGTLRFVDGRIEPIPAPEPSVRTLQRISQAIPGYTFLAEHSHLMNFIRVHVSMIETARRAKQAAAEAAARGTAYVALDPVPTFRIMDALVDSTRAHRVPLLVLFVPGLGQCAPPGWKPPRPIPDLRPNAAIVGRLVAHLDSLGVPVVYPLEELREANRSALQYFPHDFHLNERGSRRVGEALARGLIAAGLVPRGGSGSAP
jgi:hypothetical protein